MNLLYSVGPLSTDHYVPAERQMDHMSCSPGGKIIGPIREICTQLRLMESQAVSSFGDHGVAAEMIAICGVGLLSNLVNTVQ